MTTKSLVRFWRALDEIPEATTDRREWVLLLETDWPAAKSYLSPTGRRAKEIACPSPAGEGCPRKVVEHSDLKLRAVCGNRPAQCDAIEVTGDDIACLALDRYKLATALLPVLKAVPIPQMARSSPAAIIGSHPVAAGIAIPIILLVPNPLVTPSAEMLAELEGPSAILVPTANSVPDRFRGALKLAGHVILALNEVTAINDGGRLTGLFPAETLLKQLRETLLKDDNPAALARACLLPPEARWEDLHFEFIADEVLNVRFGSETYRFEPEHLGMKSAKNGRPTSLWILLLGLALQTGTLTWKDPRATTKIKKQKQLLANQLKKAFGIKEAQIIWHASKRVYQARFTIRSSIPSDGRVRASVNIHRH